MKKPHHDVIRTVGRLLSVWCIITLCALPSTLQAAPPVRDQLTVMSLNLWLGADAYAAAQFLPDLQAASQYLWENMQQTSFVARADAFADEVMRTRPDVIGLQEAANWCIAMPLKAQCGCRDCRIPMRTVALRLIMPGSLHQFVSLILLPRSQFHRIASHISMRIWSDSYGGSGLLWWAIRRRSQPHQGHNPA